MTSIAVAGRMIYLHLTTRWFSEIQPWYLLCQLKQNHTKSGCAQSGDAACGSARTLSLALGSLLLFAFPGSFQQLAAAFCKISQMARKCMDLYVMNIYVYIYIMWACLSVPQRAKIWLMLILEDYFCFLGERKPLFSSLFVVCHQNPCSLTDKGLHSSSSPSQEANASVMSTNSSAQRPWRVGHFTTFWLRNERPPKL